MALKLKLDDKGAVVLQEGKPVYIDDKDGKELAFDAEQMYGKVLALGQENKTFREKAQAAEEKLAKYGDASPEDIEGFLQTLEDLGGPDGIAALQKKAGIDVEAIKKAMTEGYEQKHRQTIEAYEQKLADANKLVTEKDGIIYKLMVSSQFGTSKYAADNLILPPDIAEATFGKHFKVEDGQVVAYLGDNKILSRENPGEVAKFDEALAVIVDKYPMKERIMKSKTGGGSGSQGGQGGQQSTGNGKIMKRDAFLALHPQAQMDFSKAGGKIED